MRNLINSCVAIVLTFVVVSECAIPDYIKVCHRKDPKLADCITSSIEGLRTHLRNGIPELQVPPLEPFIMDSIIVDATSSSSRINTNLTDVNVHGASNFKILKLVPANLKNGYGFSFEVIIPKLRIEGKYAMDTKILFLELKGNGPFNGNISDYHFSCLLRGRKVKIDGNNHLNFDQMECTLDVGKVEIYLDNLFDGNEILGRATNAAINENSQVFFEEIKPTVLDAITTRFTNISNRITHSFKYEELFP